MSFNINDVPTEDAINSGGNASISWEDWYTRVSDALKGPWGDQTVRIADDLGLSAVINYNFLRYHGDTAYFYLSVSDLDNASPVDIVLPDSNLLDGFYTEKIDSGISTKLMENKTITIPAETSSTYVVFGTFMRTK